MAVDLTKRMFSDAKADELIAAIEGLAGSGNSGMSDAAKAALINCFLKVAWVDDSGANLIQALTTALYGGDAPVDSRIIYELESGTDLNGRVINTGVPVPTYSENFTLIARATLRAKTSGDTTASMLFGSGGLSETTKATIRGCVDYSNGICQFVTNYMYSDAYANSNNISAYENHELLWIIRNNAGTASKYLFVDSNLILNKSESISAYSERTSGSNIILGSHMASQPASFNGTVSMFRIYNKALTNSELEALLGITI